MAKKITVEVPDDFDPEKHPIPDGWKIVLPGKGGRPRADLKRIAVSFARGWRMNVYSEPPSRAIDWICSHWQHHGIHDEARARARAKEGDKLIDRTMVSLLPGGCLCFKLPIQKGSRGWVWTHDVHEAIEIECVNFEGKVTIERGKPMHLNPISAAASTYSGQSQGFLRGQKPHASF